MKFSILKIKQYILIISFMLIIALVIAPPPVERVVKGIVYKDGSAQVESGIYVFIKNKNLSINKSTQTYGPPSFSGAYSDLLLMRRTGATIQGTWALHK